MGPVWYRVRWSLRRRWATNLGLGIVVAVVGAAVLVLVAGATRTLSAADRYTESQGGDPDATVEQVAGRSRAGEVAGLDAVRRVASLTFVFGGLVEDGTFVESLTFAGEREAFGARLVAGRNPDPTRPEEFLASRTFIEATGARLGDRFELATLGAEEAAAAGFEAEPTDPPLPAVLVGEITGPAELQDGYPFAVFPPSLLDVRDIGTSASQHLVWLEPGAELSDLRRQLEALPGDEEFGVEPTRLVYEEVRASAAARGQGIAVVAAVIGLGALVVVGQLLGRRLRLSDRELAVLGAVGMTSRQLRAEEVGRAVPAVASGAVAAGALAVVLSGWFPLGFVEALEPDTGLRFDPWVHLLGPVLIGLLLLGWVLLEAAMSGRRARAVVPSASVEALAARGPSVPASVGLRFAFSPSGNGSPVRALAALAVIAAGSVGALCFGASLDALLDEPGRWGITDGSVGQGGVVLPEEPVARLVADDDVMAVALTRTIVASSGGITVDVTGVDQRKGVLPVDVLAGRPALGEGEVALGRLTARDLGVGVGDRVELGVGSTRAGFEVAGIVVVASIDGGDGVGQGAMVTWTGLERLEPGITAGSMMVDLAPGREDAARARLGEELGLEFGMADPPSVISALERVRRLPVVVAGAFAALLALGLVHHLLMSARLRRRDVAVLRALGAGRGWVGAVVRWQTVLATLAVCAAGLPLGFVVGRVVFGAFIDRVGVALRVELPWWELSVAVAVMAVLALLLAALPLRRLRRHTVLADLGRE